MTLRLILCLGLFLPTAIPTFQESAGGVDTAESKLARAEPAEAKRLLDLAEEAMATARHDRDGGHWRAAVSRAYYAMFYAASAALAAQGHRPSKHQASVSLFGQHLVHRGPIEQRHQIALVAAYNDRRLADYDVSAGFSEQDVAARIDEADQFVQRVLDYLTEACPDFAAEDEHL